MAKAINTITVYPLSNLEAADCIRSFGSHDGMLHSGISLFIHTNELPITWTLRITSQADVFPIVLAQANINDPRVTLS